MAGGQDAGDDVDHRAAEKEIFEKVTDHLDNLSGKRKAKFQKDIAHRLHLDVPTTNLGTLLFGSKQFAPSVVAVLVIILVFLTIVIIVIWRPDNLALISTLASLAGTAMGIAIGRHI